MTEEQTKFLYSIADNMGTTGIEYFTCKDGEKMRDIIKALEQQSSDDCVSRQAVIDKKELIELEDGQTFYCISPEDVKALPPVTPTHGSCKDCRWLATDEDGNYYCKQTWDFDSLDFYCADFEKRGGENDNNN